MRKLLPLGSSFFLEYLSVCARDSKVEEFILFVGHEVSTSSYRRTRLSECGWLG
jgi:hypothetical protein